MNIGRETAVDHSGGHMRHTYQKFQEKPSRRTRAEFFGRQRPILTMAASHYGIRKEGKPTNIGWETAAD